MCFIFAIQHIGRMSHFYLQYHLSKNQIERHFFGKCRKILTDEKLANASSLLFFSRESNDLIESRFQAVVTRSYKTVKDLQKFLRSTLAYLRKDLQKQERPTQFSQFGDYEKFDSDIKRLDEIDVKLRQELHKDKITDEELIEAAKKQTRWGIKYIEWLIENKTKKLYRGVRDDDTVKRTF
jgi:hypothetical protein